MICPYCLVDYATTEHIDACEKRFNDWHDGAGINYAGEDDTE